MMDVLRVVRGLNLPDWWIGAGFVRGKVWDYLHAYKFRTPLPDIDVIYFDKNDNSEKREKALEQELKKIEPNLNWSVKNQARMHLLHDDPPYNNSAQGLARWVETATCVGVCLDDKGRLVLLAPHGIGDLVNLVLRPTDKSKIELFKKRAVSKHWLSKWPKLRIEI